ncbi:dynein axonemal intermediate chain 7 [Gadus morhua]|uniref:dynein axonemal intermediate chain 7 n=1 Tax=Gadus morhua TaxID=8049 RepID=UPI0011B6B08B|nr:protein CASC1 [Gadus morhua]
MSAKKSDKGVRGSAKGAKETKEAKAERERLEKEEEERRLQEKEMARLQEEQEKQERLERERREQEEMERLEAKDQERREDELNEVRHLLEENQVAVKRWLVDTREKAKWDRFMLCDGRPDPSQTQEVNTYISLWRDDPEVDAVPALQQCSLALQLIGTLEDEQEEVQEEERQRLLEHIHCLQELVHHKHLLIAQEVLNHAGSNVDIETGNMATVVRDDHVTLCVWANLNKNPRFKGFQFEEAGVAFELPKPLALSDVALRILHTRYDHLSPHARLTALGGRPLSSRTPGGEEEPSSKPGSPVQGETGEEGGEGGGGEGVGKKESPRQGKEEEVQSVPGSVRRKSAGSVLSNRSSRTRPVEEPEDQKQTQMEASEEVPAEPEEPDIVKAVDVATVDLQRYTPLGGVYYCDVFRLPPQAILARGWSLRQVLEGGLEALPYPEESSETQPGSSPEAPEAPEPVGLSLTVPDYVLLLKAPNVAIWDPTAIQWTTAGVSGVSYEADQARVSFKMGSFRAFVLLQETYCLLPLQAWTLQPLGPDSARLRVTSALITLSITVKGHQCMLQVEQEGVLSHLQGQWMGCGALRKAMANAGLNLSVNEHTDRYIRSCGKDPLSEHTAYEQMALQASAVAFSWSQWNARCGGEHMVVQACEHHGPALVPGGPWSLYLLGAQRSQKLQMTEESPAFSVEISPDTEFHSTFLHTLRDDLSPEGRAVTKTSHFLFVDTVQSLLCATRLLNYC